MPPNTMQSNTCRRNENNFHFHPHQGARAHRALYETILAALAIAGDQPASLLLLESRYGHHKPRGLNVSRTTLRAHGSSHRMRMHGTFDLGAGAKIGYARPTRRYMSDACRWCCSPH